MTLEFTTTLPAESTENGYFSITTKKAGRPTTLGNGQQHIHFYGSIEDAKKWFFNIICQCYEQKNGFDEEGFELGDTRFNFDATTNELVYVEEVEEE